MEENKDFGDVDLEGVRISNILNNQNEIKEKEEISSKLIVSDSKEKEFFNNEEKKDENLNEQLINDNNEQNQKNKMTNNFYYNYVFVFIVYLIQSLISLGFYYLSYILKFDFTDIILKVVLFIIIITFIIVICCLSREYFISNHEKLSHYLIFILINIFKIIYDILLYLMMISDTENDGIDFSFFEARAYWKITISFYYLFLLIISYFEKDQNNINISLYLIAAGVCLIICFLLIFFTQKEYNNMFRILNYSGYMALELFFTIYAIYYQNMQKKGFEYIDIKLEWRVNRIDFLRFGMFIFAVLLNLINYFTKKCRFCRKTD